MGCFSLSSGDASGHLVPTRSHREVYSSWILLLMDFRPIFDPRHGPRFIGDGVPFHVQPNAKSGSYHIVCRIILHKDWSVLMYAGTILGYANTLFSA